MRLPSTGSFRVMVRLLLSSTVKRSTFSCSNSVRMSEYTRSVCWWAEAVR